MGGENPVLNHRLLHRTENNIFFISRPPSFASFHFPPAFVYLIKTEAWMRRGKIAEQNRKKLKDA